MDLQFITKLVIYIIGVVVGTGIITRATNKFIFKSFGRKQKAFYSFITVSVFSVLGYGVLAFIGTVIWLIYDLRRVPENKNHKRINLFG
ncbi:hypothetical protein [Virgibacillus oceani]|uniref:Uncharacterized protein n=1 Tax=Virgibacillus oceani TaxID=1479511 RepID=A0A917GY68_9BACI|nr:hypothetical protein [Virgibacillus oceani]GGG60975.1 hypothetical protein GCM10011398_00260 [Virgibacillus oceani]